MALADMATISATHSMAMLSNADVVWGAYECRAIYSMPGREIFDGEAISDDHSIVFITADLPGIANGQTLTVNSSSFKARTPRKIDDGALSYVGLAPA